MECKLECNLAERSLMMMQHVLMQSFKDEFEIPEDYWLVTVSIPGSILMKYDPTCKLTSERQRKYNSDIGKLLHLMPCTIPEEYNPVQELPWLWQISYIIRQC